ncbi:MAG: DUF3857 domain-containing protein [Flavobacteriaceae bacterium]|nr:DUF3857 domain-containing protein [Flavobacteriaceae bacterium]
MKKYFTLFLFLISFHTFSQKGYTFGKITQQESEMTVYEKDSTANAVVLYAEGNTEFFEKHGYIYIRTVIYKKIKIFNKEAANHTNVNIFLYNNKNRRESVKKIRGVTHTNGMTTPLSKNNIYTKRLSEKNSKTTFTLPNIQDGSIVEYTYTIESPFTFNLTGWSFQTSIPTKESVFKAQIPGNYVYNRTLIGYQKLVRNKSTLKKRCFRVDGIDGYADCEVLVYSMKDIPAFIEEEYMTSKKNYISRIVFEQSEVNWFDGTKKKYTKTWKSVDKEFKSDKEIGGQLRKKMFFSKKIPQEVYNETDLLKRAKKVYQFIQNHYTWNKKYRIFNDINVTKAFNAKVGNISEINISLINSLNASNIHAELVLLSTRENGFPIKLHPVMTDFDYVIAKIVIDNKTYFLDATGKNLPFGVLPYKCLNRVARVMDFKNGSYWEDIIPIKNSGKKIQMILKLNEREEFTGNMRISYKGYNAIDKREEFDGIKEEKYLNDYEGENDFLEIVEYKNFNLNKKDKEFTEEYKIIIENEPSTANNILLYPFFIDKINENPFKLDDRQYPVDFGYPRSFDFTLFISFPENYTIESIPQNKLLKLPKAKGHFYYKINQINNKVTLNFSYSLSNPHFGKSEYKILKSFFKHIINSQNEPIVLKKN